MKQSPQKSLWCIPILAVTYNISNNRFVHRCWKISCSKHVGFSILVKKIVSLDFGWVGIWRTESVKGVLLKSFFSFGKEETSRKVFMLRPLFTANLQSFLIKLQLTLFASVKTIMGVSEKSLQSQDGKERFRKTKKVHTGICNIHHIYFKSASEIFFLGWKKDRNAKLYNFSSDTNRSGDGIKGASSKSNSSFQPRWTSSHLISVEYFILRAPPKSSRCLLLRITQCKNGKSRPFPLASHLTFT